MVVSVLPVLFLTYREALAQQGRKRFPTSAATMEPTPVGWIYDQGYTCSGDLRLSRCGQFLLQNVTRDSLLVAPVYVECLHTRGFESGTVVVVIMVELSLFDLSPAISWLTINDQAQSGNRLQSGH